MSLVAVILDLLPLAVAIVHMACANIWYEVRAAEGPVVEEHEGLAESLENRGRPRTGAESRSEIFRAEKGGMHLQGFFAVGIGAVAVVHPVVMVVPDGERRHETRGA